MLKKILKKLFLRPPLASVSVYQEYISIGDKSRVEGLEIQLRNPELGKKYLSIGNDSVVQGNFIFEKETGFIKIGNNTFIGGGTFICIDNIEIGDDVMFAWGCTVVDNNSHSFRWGERKNDVKNWKRGLDEHKIGFYKEWQNVKKSSVIIKNKAWIGFSSIILKGVTIGEGSIVGAGSVVTKDVPDWTIVAGNPATIIRVILEDERG